jgi:hypothetical protein
MINKMNQLPSKKLFILLWLWAMPLFVFSETQPIETIPIASLPTETLSTVSTPSLESAVLTENQPAKPTFSEEKQKKMARLEEKEKNLNKLFFSPEERKKLDDRKEILYKDLQFTQFIKDNAISFSENTNTETMTSKNKSEKNDVYFKGIVKRSDGKNFIWVNQQKIQTYQKTTAQKKESTKSPDLEASLSKKLSNGVYEVELKPGQIWLKNGEKVSEGYLLFDASTLK